MLNLILKLEDGRKIGIKIADADGGDLRAHARRRRLLLLLAGRADARHYIRITTFPTKFPDAW